MMTNTDTDIPHETEFCRCHCEDCAVPLELDPNTKSKKSRNSLTPGEHNERLNEIFEKQARPDEVLDEQGSIKVDCKILLTESSPKNANWLVGADFDH